MIDWENARKALERQQREIAEMHKQQSNGSRQKSKV